MAQGPRMPAIFAIVPETTSPLTVPYHSPVALTGIAPRGVDRLVWIFIVILTLLSGDITAFVSCPLSVKPFRVNVNAPDGVPDCAWTDAEEKSAKVCKSNRQHKIRFMSIPRLPTLAFLPLSVVVEGFVKLIVNLNRRVRL